MGIYDRDYTRPTRVRQASNLTPVTKWLLIVNVAVCVLDLFILKRVPFRGEEYPPLSYWGAFSIQGAVFEGRIWEFLTFQFLHAGVGHILANSMGLYFFGPWMERWWGSMRFLAFYLLCGVAGAAFFMLLVFCHFLGDTVDTPLIGASAGIFGILMGVAMVAPDLRVRLLFPPIELTMRQLAMVLLAIAVGSIVFRLGGNEGGEAGHLGGAILGFVLVKWPFLLGRGRLPSFTRSVPLRTEPKLRPRTTVDLQTSSEVDRLLDKISRDGFQSLTDDERDTLRKASEDNPR